MRLAVRVTRHRSGPVAPRTAQGHASARLLFAALAIVASVILPGCERNSPHGVARRYLENLRQSNYAACYAMLADQDRKDRSLAEFLTEIPMAPDVGPALFRPVLHSIQYEIGDPQRDGDNAFVPVKVTAPDLPLWERTLAAAGAGHAGGQNAERSLASGDFPKVTYDDAIFLTKEHHHWHIVAGFVARDRIVDLHREAVVDYHQYDYAKVISSYQSMIADLDRLKATGAAGLAARYRAELAAARAVQADTPASTAYAAKKLTLGDVAMRMSEERVPAIFGTVTNTGDRALDGVQIAVTWYAGRGKDLKAAYTEKHPIVTTPIEFTDFSLPVFPFIPGEKRPFGFILTAPVQVQQDAAPYVTISAIAFTHSVAPLPKLASAKAPQAAAASATPSAPSSPPGVAVTKPSSPPNSSPSPQSVPHSSVKKVAS